ncbi:class I SAM-dependent RNA methyltransferase [Tessaracoccus sp. ZS01]|uniref:class I SAM-dependent RNA methyltransferase n=1 Tax=Tessaracoccus sp. ZS01 TaxID=1906324 RepID=UPI00096C3C91|nr:TRAM domain-containing protein [Tessaracoccus sp. ZS01]MCG6566457.1 class I SAM-dependent RNA methyltransferase [Tessaracoccus sp. ZS01]OMG58906.1 SAM-dependent methyltransferase [Tessaracoccus sp. ZS01]
MMTEVMLERVAHGGYIVGRLDGKVVFVTGGLPGERVRLEITDRGSKFDRGRVTEVLDAAPGRVVPPCPIAGRCGGCDWQHADADTQLALKTAVVAEQLERLAGLTWDGEVEAVPGGLLDWRTRVRYAVDDDGSVGLRARRSHDIVPLPDQGCLIAAPGSTVEELQAFADPGVDLEVTVADRSVTLISGRRLKGPDPVQQKVLGRTYTVAAGGFWQVHPAAAETLSRAVLDGLRPEPGERAMDLYCGVGLFAGALADAGCLVLGVEAGRGAVELARRNVPEGEFYALPVERADRQLPEWADLIVLDPPRKGAGAGVVRAVAARRPRAIAYVACDPAALARDLKTFAAEGYEPVSIRGFDLFPMTHHIECVAILHPAS